MSHLPIVRNIKLGGMRTTDIADLAKITKQTAGALITALVEMRSIKRYSDSSDGRAKLVSFARRGKDLMEQLPAIMQRAEADIIDIIGIGDFEKLTTVLMRLVRSSGEDTPAAMLP